MIHHISKVPLDWKHGATVFFFGDRQQGSAGYRKEAWQEFKHEFKTTKNAWAIGLGDYGDVFRTSMRATIIQAVAKDDEARRQLDDEMRPGVEGIMDEMAFLKGRVLGLHEGHHNWKFATGENSDQRIAASLKAPYLGWSATTRLVLVRQTQATKDGLGDGRVVTMFTTHGNANGRKVHSSLAWMEANFFSSWDADLFVMGHGCKNGSSFPGSKNRIRRRGLPGIEVQVPRLMAVGGFAQGYTDGFHSDYVERAGFAPQPLGWGIARFKLVHSKAGSLAAGVGSRLSGTLQIEHLNRVLEM